MGNLGLLWGVGLSSRTVLGSTHLVEQLSFSMIPSILTFDFYLILGSFLSFFGAIMGYFWGLGRVTVLGSLI